MDQERKEHVDVPQRLSMVALGVSDLDRSSEFYEALGWSRSPASNSAITLFETDGSLLGLYSRRELAADAHVDHVGEGFRGTTLAINCASKRDVDACHARWKAAGARTTKPPGPADWGYWQGYSAYVLDPDGHRWELVHNPHIVVDADGRDVSAD